MDPRQTCTLWWHQHQPQSQSLAPDPTPIPLSDNHDNVNFILVMILMVNVPFQRVSSLYPLYYIRMGGLKCSCFECVSTVDLPRFGELAVNWRPLDMEGRRDHRCREHILCRSNSCSCSCLCSVGIAHTYLLKFMTGSCIILITMVQIRNLQKSPVSLD